MFFRWRRTPFYIRQLQVLFETQFFHITTAQALYELTTENTFTKIPHHLGTTHLEFIVPLKVATDPRTSRALHSHMRLKSKIVAKYSAHQVLDDLGDHLESLVKQELRANGLTNIQKNARSYKGRSWTRTGHDLDFVADHPTGEAFGVEVKNELGEIDSVEFSTKLEMCEYLGLRPIFIVRYLPWSLTPRVRDQGGYVITLGNQIYPLGYRRLVEEIRSRLSLAAAGISPDLKTVAPKLRQEWPVEVRTDFPEDASRRLADWLHTVIG